jgi:hypothetical protein
MGTVSFHWRSSWKADKQRRRQILGPVNLVIGEAPRSRIFEGRRRCATIAANQAKVCSNQSLPFPFAVVSGAEPHLPEQRKLSGDEVIEREFHATAIHDGRRVDHRSQDESLGLHQ